MSFTRLFGLVHAQFLPGYKPHPHIELAARAAPDRNMKLKIATLHTPTGLLHRRYRGMQGFFPATRSKNEEEGRKLISYSKPRALVRVCKADEGIANYQGIYSLAPSYRI